MTDADSVPAEFAFPLPGSVRVVEVGPRDGLQNEREILPTSKKIDLLRMLARCGLQEIEVTSFVHPKWIPALSDAEEVAQAARDLPIRSFALVPNRRALERAIQSRVYGVTLVMSCTEAHNKANLNRSVADSLAELIDLAREARQIGLERRISLSVVFGCPFEGRVPVTAVTSIVEDLVRSGSRRIGLCDTIGVANPKQVFALCRSLRESFPQVEFELHLHDTYGRALANTVAGLAAGIASFDTSIGGLGGCPYAPGATGNVATEDTVAMLHGMGVSTGVNETALQEPYALLRKWRGSLPGRAFAQCTS